MIELKPGDIFCSRNPMALGRAINIVQRIWSSDNDSKYSHSGIIVGPCTSFEALWSIKKQNFFDAYTEQGVIIGRHREMSRALFLQGYEEVAPHEGRWYPFHRLPFFLFPPLSKYLATGRWTVCSELAAKFLVGCGLLKYYRGKNPDHLADIIRNYKGWDIVFEGKL